jgi:hypothetical protein
MEVGVLNEGGSAGIDDGGEGRPTPGRVCVGAGAVSRSSGPGSGKGRGGASVVMATATAVPTPANSVMATAVPTPIQRYRSVDRISSRIVGLSMRGASRYCSADS